MSEEVQKYPGNNGSLAVLHRQDLGNFQVLLRACNHAICRRYREYSSTAATTTPRKSESDTVPTATSPASPG